MLLVFSGSSWSSRMAYCVFVEGAWVYVCHVGDGAGGLGQGSKLWWFIVEGKVSLEQSPDGAGVKTAARLDAHGDRQESLIAKAIGQTPQRSEVDVGQPFHFGFDAVEEVYELWETGAKGVFELCGRAFWPGRAGSEVLIVVGVDDEFSLLDIADIFSFESELAPVVEDLETLTVEPDADGLMGQGGRNGVGSSFY